MTMAMISSSLVASDFRGGGGGALTPGGVGIFTPGGAGVIRTRTRTTAIILGTIHSVHCLCDWRKSAQGFLDPKVIDGRGNGLLGDTAFIVKGYIYLPGFFS
jgi:hypothetical protein